MLHAGEIVLEHGHLALGGVEDFVQLVRELRLRSAANLGQRGNGILQTPVKSRNGNAEFFTKWAGEAVGLRQQGSEQVFARDLGLLIFRGGLHGGIEGLAKFDRKFFRSHDGESFPAR